MYESFKTRDSIQKKHWHNTEELKEAFHSKPGNWLKLAFHTL